MALVETCTAPSNIAVIKYWGKKSVALNTPINSSVSVTLSQDDLCAQTSVMASKDFTQDRLWLNGVEEDVSKSSRIQVCLREVRRLAADRVDAATGEVLVRREDWPQYKVHIVSANTFPTAAGLASSAAGYACLVATLAKLYCAVETYPGELSAIARQGSGSACRSLYGGFVRWNMGTAEDAKDSHAVQVADEAHWPELESLILVVSDRKKDTSSTAGMGTSVETSELLGFRAAQVVEPRLARIEQAYRERDFETFAQITMADSNQFHATCMDTYPPIFYMNETSRNIVRLVHYYNRVMGVRACYTFDAGPNAVLFGRAQHLPHLLAFLSHFLPAADLAALCDKPAMVAAANAAKATLDADLVANAPVDAHSLDVKMIYHTTVGDGPRTLALSQALLDVNTGMPLKTAAPAPAPSSAVVAVAPAAAAASSPCCASSPCWGMVALAVAAVAVAAVVVQRRR